MKLIIFLVLLGLVGLFALQNLQVIQLVFFGGILTLKLPVIVWLILFTLAGLLTSLLLQVLTSYPRSSAPQVPPRPTVPPSPKPQPQPVYKTKDPIFDDWDLQQTSPAPSPPTKETEIPEFPRRKVEEKTPSQEKIPSHESPPTTLQNETIYPYTYREEEKSAEKAAKPVYDADYRVITPPYRSPDNPTPVDDDSEEWV
jgi:hypothetical protein